MTAGLIAAATERHAVDLITLARGEDVLDGARAAGAMVLPRETRTVPLLAAADARPPDALGRLGRGARPRAPAGREVAGGVAGGLLIAALDLGVIGRRLPAIRSLPQPRQWADHVAYGLTVGAVLARLRAP